MCDIEIIEEHLLIRETTGYDILKDIDVIDIPQVLKFLKIVSNYSKLKRIENESNRN